MNLLAKAQYDEARGALRNFADTYPKATPMHRLRSIGLAISPMCRRTIPTAARTFAESIKKYPAGQRAPESMLKFGQSLIAMNQKDEGCTALARPLGQISQGVSNRSYAGASRTQGRRLPALT